jgi:hypothetical protein
MKTQYTREEVGKMLQWAVFITGVILFVIGVFAGLSMAISSPECSERETTTEILKYECDEVIWNMDLCFGSEPENCLPTNGSFPLCKQTPYEKQIIKEIKK